MKLRQYLKNIACILAFLLPLCCFSQELKFNNQYSVACHNCYEKKLATDFQDVFTYTKTVELDIWNDNFGLGFVANLLGKRLKNDWYVKHKPQQRGNQNCVGGSFRDCLLQIKAWSEAHPAHDVVTIYIDKKQNWGDAFSSKRPVDLDNLLVSIFSKNEIFKPADLQGGFSTLKQAALSNWPVLDSLKGKFVFVLTDGTVFNLRKPLAEYEKTQQQSAVCFVAPRIGSEKEILQPKGFSKEQAQNVVFYNLQDKHGQLAGKIGTLECISRVYGAAKQESFDYYNQLVNEKVNFVALYNYRVVKDCSKEQPTPPLKKSSL